ncbi:probable glutamate receptor isoform X3 [Athalia rosae]|uniref:probable glutamate receptor isoform X3 n=1 Tax=Athalia rosae TaxID=37344 RepID=UPI0020342203|nr:probable glutamate receptor isoform X3 [Athalia rosae]
MTPVRIVLILATTSFSLQPIGFCQLIRPNYVYRNLISGIHDHFNNTCILLLHATVDPLTSPDGTRNAVRLLNLQRYFSQERHTRTAIMDLATFTSKVGIDYFRIKRPLFVILNDQGDIRQLLTNQISTWITMAYPTWIMFLSEGTEPAEFFKGMNIPFDCEFMVSNNVGQTEVITEVYRVSPGDVLRTSNFAIWTPEGGVRITGLQGLYQRRADLFGKTLWVTSIQNPPMSTILNDEHGEMIGIGGMFGRILDILEDNMNCSFRYVEGKAWGVLSPNGTWNGMIALLIDKVADLAASELVLTSTRINAVDFTIPIISSRFHTYIKRPSSLFISWKGYTAPFATSIWLALGSLIILSSVVITVTEYVGHRYDVNRYGDSPRPRLGSTVLAVFGAFCGQGMLASVLPTTRAAHLTVHLTSVILIAAYSAALISFLAVQTFTMPFTTMEGLLRDGTYRFGVTPNSAEYSLFSNTTDPVLRALFEERMVPDEQLPITYIEGLHTVCREDGYGFMITDTMVGALENQVDCALEALETMLQTSLAMAVAKNSPYRGIIDANILMMRDGGILNRIIESEWPTKFSKAEESWTSVKFGDVLPLVIVLAGGIILGVFVACAERAVVGRLHCNLVPRGGRPTKFEPSALSKYTPESDRLSKPKINVVSVSNK